MGLASRRNPSHAASDAEPDTSVIDVLTQLWRGYLTLGREALRGLGERVLLEPDLVAGFARLDMVIGRSLVEVKCSAEPGPYLQQGLDQLLG